MEPFKELVTTQQDDPAAEPVTTGGVEIEAEFTLEAAAICPACRCSLETVGIVRLLRTRVNFVSTLPRRGHLMICPQCKTVLAGGLGRLV